MRYRINSPSYWIRLFISFTYICRSIFTYLFVCSFQLSVEGNTVIENLFDEWITKNEYKAKVEAVQALEDHAKKAEMEKAYVDSVHKAIVQAKILAKKALVTLEA